jgi:hypothetical protein
MAILGSLIALGAAVAFVVIVGLAVWGGLLAIRQELLRGFVSANPGPADRALTLLLVGVPLAGVAAIGLLGALRLALVALGMG